MSDLGFVKIDRKILEWEWFQNPDTVILFLYCILKANIKDKKWQGITIKRGSFVTSLDKLSKETGLSIRRVRTNLDRLKESGAISTHTATYRYTLVTIEKYGFYQDSSKKSTYKTTSQRQTNDKLTTITKEYIKNDKNIYRGASPTLQDIQDYILEKNYKVNAEKFFTYYESRKWKSGRTSIKNCWQSKVDEWETTELDLKPKSVSATHFDSERNYSQEQLAKLTQMKLQRKTI